MPPVVIDNPILNSPFKEPTRHFQFSEDGITDQAVDGRRESGYFLPIASPRRKGGQLKFDTEWTQDRFQSSPPGSTASATTPVPGRLALFSNVDGDRWSASPNSIQVDSEQLESGEAMSDEFKRIAAIEIDELKAEYRARFPGRDSDDLTDEDLLREVMNTVGKKGKLGEQIRCVVSVSMLTEGLTIDHISQSAWDVEVPGRVLRAQEPPITRFGTTTHSRGLRSQVRPRTGGAGRERGGASPSAAQARGPQRARLRVGVEAPPP